MTRLSQTDDGKASLQLLGEHNNAILAAERTEGGSASLEIVSKYNELANDFQKILQERDEALAKLGKLSKEGAHDNGETKHEERTNKRKYTSQGGEDEDDAKPSRNKKPKRGHGNH